MRKQKMIIYGLKLIGYQVVPADRRLRARKCCLLTGVIYLPFGRKKILLSYLGSPYLALAEKSPPSPFNVLRTNCQTSLCGYKFGYVEVKKTNRRKLPIKYVRFSPRMTQLNIVND